jgi:hypothetical protein
MKGDREWQYMLGVGDLIIHRNNYTVATSMLSLTMVTEWQTSYKTYDQHVCSVIRAQYNFDVVHVLKSFSQPFLRHH